MKTPEDKTVREAQSREQYDPTAKQKAAAKLSRTRARAAHMHDYAEKLREILLDQQVDQRCHCWVGASREISCSSISALPALQMLMYSKSNLSSMVFTSTEPPRLRRQNSISLLSGCLM